MGLKLHRDKLRFFIFSSAGIIALSFFAYSGTLNAFFTSDDFGMLAFGRYGKLSDVLRLFAPISTDILIRPFSMLTWFLDYRLWGLHALGYRLVNLTMHSINSILVMFLAFFLLKNKAVALGAGLLFAVHSLHADVVSHIAFRLGLMCDMFYLLSLASFAFCAYKEKYRVFYFFSIFCYPLALFSKETAITLPLAIIIYDVFSKKIVSSKIFISRIKFYLPYITITVVYIFWRLVFTGTIGGYTDFDTGKLGFLEFNLADYLRKIFYHIPLEFLVPVNQAVFGHDLSRLILLLIISSILTMVIISWKELLNNCKLIFFGFLWAIITLIPAHNLVREINVPAGTKFVYLPSVGLCIVMAFIILAGKAKGIRRYVSLTIFAILCAAYVFITVKNNSVWIAAGEINRSIPTLINEYHKRHGARARFFFLIPDSTREGIELFGNDLPQSLAPLFAPVDVKDVVLLSEGDHATDPAYISNDFDLRQPEVLQGLGSKIFFFRYNEEKAAFEDLSLHIKSDFSKIPASRGSLEFPKLALSGYAGLNYISPPLKIPADLIGGMEIKMRIQKEGVQGLGNILWYKGDGQEPLTRSFFVERDNMFHIYRIPLAIHKPEWAVDSIITKIEILPHGGTEKTDIEYIKLLPYRQ